MKMMMLFCMARVAVALAGLAVMAYVALGCTWAAIEETAPIAQSDDGACLRVDYPLIAPGACSAVGIEEVDSVPIRHDHSTNRWVEAKVSIPAEAEWWLVKPPGAGYTVVNTADLRDLTGLPNDDDTDPTAGNSIRIPGGGDALIALSRTNDQEDPKLLVWRAESNFTVKIHRLITAPAPTE